MDKVIEVIVRPEAGQSTPSGGGGGHSGDTVIPSPDSVGTEEIKDDSIRAEDINHEAFATDNDIEQLFEKP